MELTETGVQSKRESNEHRTDFNDLEILAAAQHLCSVEIKETRGYGINDKLQQFEVDNVGRLSPSKLKLNTSHPDESSDRVTIEAYPMYVKSLDSKGISEEFQSPANQACQVFIDRNSHVQTTNYNISMVNIPSEFLGFNLMIKKEADVHQELIYTTEWLRDTSSDTDLYLKISRKKKQKSQICANNKGPLVATKRHRILIAKSIDGVNCEVKEHCKNTKPGNKLRSTVFQDYKGQLRKKDECMRERQRKLYERESKDQRQQRLAQEAARRREMRMYYETPEQKRKRLDAEAARKREYRMYSETPEDRRKRLDREAERRRTKRLSLYASETPEQRRERLNKESAKRREARLNQYAKETEEQRRERLRRDALRAREMRFTRSAIETEEERRQRLVKDALRKREVRMHGGRSVSNNFTELQTVRNFEELNNVQIKDNPDNQLGGHYLSNWMMWFQNTLAQPIHVGEQSVECQSQTNR